MSDSLHTLKVFFPGRRYSIDRSFLYFLDKYIDGDSIYLDYDHKRYEKDELTIEEDVARAYKIAKEKLTNIDYTKYSEIIFIAKSLGTVVAGKIREELKMDRIRFICLTPLNETLSFLKQTDFILTSHADKHIDVSSLEEKSFMYPFLTIYDDVSHSLEYPNNYAKTIDFLKINLDLILNYLDTSYKDILLGN